MSPRSSTKLRGLRVTVLGDGNAGRAFAKALASRGARVSVWTRRSRRKLPGPEAATDLVLFCVRDDAIESVAGELARAWRRRAGKPPVALHTSGFHGQAVLRELARAGFATGSIHPLVPLKGASSAPDLAGAWFATSASGPAAAMARRLIAGLEGKELRLPPGDSRKRSWHLACALVANGAVSLFDLALEHAGPKAAAPLAAMLETVAKRLAHGPRAALTGPTPRGEEDVVAGHLALLRGRSGDAELYRLLSRRLLALADLPPSRRRAIARRLR
jgi:predicted short-subunit dehydrogenase-like oxidoreductase (DUF2520 family)